VSQETGKEHWLTPLLLEAVWGLGPLHRPSLSDDIPGLTQPVVGAEKLKVLCREVKRGDNTPASKAIAV